MNNNYNHKENNVEQLTEKSPEFVRSTPHNYASFSYQPNQNSEIDNGLEQLKFSKNLKSFSYPQKYQEESSVEYSNNKREFNEGDNKIAPYLILTDEEGGNLLSNKDLIIKATGLVNGCRKMKDGVTFFGTEISINDKVVNDYLLNFPNKDKQLGAYVFIIYYKKDMNGYSFRACRDKTNYGYSMLFVKLSREYYLKPKEIINIGDLYIKIVTDDMGMIEISKMGKVKSANSDNKNEYNKKHVFKKEEGIIRIGRIKSCQVCFEEETTFSKINTTIIWDREKNNWKIIDGKDLNKQSTNGTWLYAAHSYEILGDTICKIGSSKFKISMQFNK